MSVENILSLLIGSVITWVAAQHYYVKAAKELNEETEKMRNLFRISLQAMEDAGMVALNRASDDSVVGMVHNLSGDAAIRCNAKAELSVVKNSLESHE